MRLRQVGVVAAERRANATDPRSRTTGRCVALQIFSCVRRREQHHRQGGQRSGTEPMPRSSPDAAAHVECLAMSSAAAGGCECISWRVRAARLATYAQLSVLCALSAACAVVGQSRTTAWLEHTCAPCRRTRRRMHARTSAPTHAHSCAHARTSGPCRYALRSANRRIGDRTAQLSRMTLRNVCLSGEQKPGRDTNTQQLTAARVVTRLDPLPQARGLGCGATVCCICRQCRSLTFAAHSSV
jgi:hypothetical protein